MNMMKKMLLLVLVLLVCVFAMACGGGQSSPEGTIKQLEEGYNNLDMNTIIGCYAPEYQNEMRTEVKELEESIGMSWKDYMKETGVEMKVELTVSDKEIEGDYAEMKVRMKVKGDAGFIPEGEYDSPTITMVRVGGKWYVDTDMGLFS